MTLIKVSVEGKIREIMSENEEVRLEDVLRNSEDIYKGYPMAAKVGNKLMSLNETVKEDDKVEFIDTCTEDGKRIYSRVLSFVFVIACRKLYENVVLSAQHSLSDGIYYTIDIGRKLNKNDIKAIKTKMSKIIEKNCEIKEKELSKGEARSLFRVLGQEEKAEIIEKRDSDKAKIYECDGYISHFYGMMLPSTGYIKTFDVIGYKEGVVLMGPSDDNRETAEQFSDQPKLSQIYNEYESWSDTLGVKNVNDLNNIINNGEYGELIRTVEALQEKKISQIADIIKERGSRVVLIAAPSSSGKTSFAHRLSIQLKVSGLTSKAIGIDDYFVDREHTPLDEDGKHDYESVNAVDIEKFNKDINMLLNGEEIEGIKFDFLTGKRVYTGEKISLKKDQVLIIEGIHGLNPELTKYIDREKKFRIYISALTQINLDSLNRIPTTDLRLIRRIVRDSNFRGYSASDTIKNWKSVRRGEKKNIFPYQEEADVMFNSACVYELSVLKKYAYPLLKAVGEDTDEHIEAVRLISFMQYFDSLEDTADIPPTAIIREFIGGSRIL